jgi:uncharacterized OB-fold protein
MLNDYVAAVLCPPEHRRALGWLCPTCGGVFAPWVATCLRCPTAPPTPASESPEFRAVAEWLENLTRPQLAAPPPVTVEPVPVDSKPEPDPGACTVCGWLVKWGRVAAWTSSEFRDAKPLHAGCVARWKAQGKQVYNDD